MIVFKGLPANEQVTFYATGIVCSSLLIYCAMIFPFLKVIVTMTLTLFCFS